MTSKKGRPNTKKIEVMLLIASGYDSYKKIKDLKNIQQLQYYGGNLNKSINALLNDKEKNNIIFKDHIKRKYNKRVYYFNWDYLFKKLISVGDKLVNELKIKSIDLDNELRASIKIVDTEKNYIIDTNRISTNMKKMQSIYHDMLRIVKGTEEIWKKIKENINKDQNFQSLLKDIFKRYFENLILLRQTNSDIEKILLEFIMLLHQSRDSHIEYGINENASFNHNLLKEYEDLVFFSESINSLSTSLSATSSLAVVFSVNKDIVGGGDATTQIKG